MRTDVDMDVIETIDAKRLNWHVRMRRMPEERGPHKIWKWQQPVKRRRRRPKVSWKDGVKQEMNSRNYLLDEDWRNRRRLKVGCEKRRKV